MRKKLNIVIGILALIGLAFSVYLSISELVTGETCPRFFTVPACYIIGLAYLIVLPSLVIRDRSINRALFFIAVIVGLFIGIWFTLAHMTGSAECPVILGVPLCYANTVLFLIITILKMIKLN